MKVRLYEGSLKIVEKSGVGQAIHHQKAMLQNVGVETTEKNDSDVAFVHFNTVFPDSLFAAALARLRGQRVIYYGHSTMQDFRNSFKGSNVLAPLFKQWIRLCYSRGNAIITPTEYSRRVLMSYGLKRPIYALTNGIDTEFFRFRAEGRQAFREKYGLADEDKAVISVGHYIFRKGILDFIALARTMPQVRFFWFGYTDPKLIPRAIHAAIEAAPENLSFPGYIDQQELRDAYCGCDLFCFMSHEETEGIVVLEALACSIPVLVRDIPVYKGWLRAGENVYKGRDLSSFQHAAEDILSGNAADLREAGRKTAEARSIHETGKQLLAIYEKVAEDIQAEKT